MKKVDNKNKKIKQNDLMNGSFKWLFLIVTSFIVVICISIIFYIFVEGIKPFINGNLNLFYFLFGSTYFPKEGLYACGFMLINTIWISLLSIIFALPISLFTAIAITRTNNVMISKIFSTAVAILASIPSIIYGIFGAYVFNSLISIIFGVSGGTVLAVVLTLSAMIIPTMTLVIVNSINSLDKNIEYASYALGATKNQTNLFITLKAIIPGIIAGILLGIGRAIGEATAVSIVATQGYGGPTFNLFEPVRLLTATMLQGFGELSASELQIRFSMAILLLVAILIVFGTVKYLGKQLSPEYQHQKLQSKYESKDRILWLANEIGYDNLTRIEKNLFKKYQLIEENTNKIGAIDENFSVDTFKPSIKYRKRNDLIIKSTTYLFSSIGLILLLSVIIFLFVLGLPGLNWHFLSSKYSDSYFEATFTVIVPDDFSNATISLDPNYVYCDLFGFGLQKEVLTDGTIVFWIVDISPDSPINDVVNEIGNDNYLYMGNIITINGLQYPITNLYLFELIDFYASGHPGESYEVTFSLVERNHGIVGSLWTTILLIIFSMLITIPIGICASIYFAEYAKPNRFNNFLKSSIDLLSGLPSIIFGLIGSAVLLIIFPMDFALIAASIMMALILMPSIINITINALNNVPKQYEHGSIGLGATKFHTIWKIKLPQISTQIISGSILLIGRVIGETAAIVMILGFMPNDVFTLGESTTLATQIWGSMQGEIADYQTACAISLVIIFIIFMLYLASEYVTKDYFISATFILLVLISFIISFSFAQLWLFALASIAIIIWVLFEIINSLLSYKDYHLNIRYRYRKYRTNKKLRIEEI